MSDLKPIQLPEQMSTWLKSRQWDVGLVGERTGWWNLGIRNTKGRSEFPILLTSHTVNSSQAFPSPLAHYWTRLPGPFSKPRILVSSLRWTRIHTNVRSVRVLDLTFRKLWINLTWSFTMKVRFAKLARNLPMTLSDSTKAEWWLGCTIWGTWPQVQMAEIGPYPPPWQHSLGF